MPGSKVKIQTTFKLFQSYKYITSFIPVLYKLKQKGKTNRKISILNGLGYMDNSYAK